MSLLGKETTALSLRKEDGRLNLGAAFQLHPYALTMRLVAEGIRAQLSRGSEGSDSFMRNMLHGTSAFETVLCKGLITAYSIDAPSRGSSQLKARTLLTAPIAIRGARNSDHFELIDLGVSSAESVAKQFPELRVNPHLVVPDIMRDAPWGRLQDTATAREIDAKHKDSQVFLFCPKGGRDGEYLVLVVPPSSKAFFASSSLTTAADALELLGLKPFSERAVIYQYEHSNKPSNFAIPPFPWMQLTTDNGWSSGVIVGVSNPDAGGASMVIGIPKHEFADIAASNILSAFADPGKNGLGKFDGPFEDPHLSKRTGCNTTVPYVFYRFSGVPEELGSTLEKFQKIAERQAVESLEMPAAVVEN